MATWVIIWWLNSSVGNNAPSSWEATRRHLAEREYVAKAEIERLRLLESQLRQLAAHPPSSPFVVPSVQAREHDEVEALRRENARLEETNRDLRAALPMDDYRTIRDRRGGGS